MKLQKLLGDRFLLARRGIIVLLAGLLIFYHIDKVSGLYFGANANDHSSMIDLQSTLRLAIALSLALVVFGIRPAVWAMWLSITALVITQYLVHYGPQPPEFTLSRSGFSYLRGFIFPTIITLVFPYKQTAPKGT